MIIVDVCHQTNGSVFWICVNYPYYRILDILVGRREINPSVHTWQGDVMIDLWFQQRVSLLVCKAIVILDVAAQLTVGRAARFCCIGNGKVCLLDWKREVQCRVESTVLPALLFYELVIFVVIRHCMLVPGPCRQFTFAQCDGCAGKRKINRAVAILLLMPTTSQVLSNSMNVMALSYSLVQRSKNENTVLWMAITQKS